MCLIGVLNLKEIDPKKGYFWLKVIVLNQGEEAEEEKCEEIRNVYLANY